jgi:hypothetical protein
VRKEIKKKMIQPVKKQKNVGGRGRNRGRQQQQATAAGSGSYEREISSGCTRSWVCGGSNYKVTAGKSSTPVQQANQAHRVQQAKQTHQAASKRSKMGQEAREERVQRDREVGGEERIGGKMPEETQRVVREDQSGKGSIWRKEEVRPEGLEAGLVKEKGPRRQMDGSRRGRTSAQAM